MIPYGVEWIGILFYILKYRVRTFVLSSGNKKFIYYYKVKFIYYCKVKFMYYCNRAMKYKIESEKPLSAFLSITAIEQFRIYYLIVHKYVIL